MSKLYFMEQTLSINIIITLVYGYLMQTNYGSEVFVFIGCN